MPNQYFNQPEKKFTIRRKGSLHFTSHVNYAWLFTSPMCKEHIGGLLSLHEPIGSLVLHASTESPVLHEPMEDLI